MLLLIWRYAPLGSKGKMNLLNLQQAKLQAMSSYVVSQIGLNVYTLRAVNINKVLLRQS